VEVFVRYKDFPKHDFRRCLLVLVTLEKLGARATLHYTAQALECTRAEILRAIELAQHQFFIGIDKNGPVYRIISWGVLDRGGVVAALRQDAGDDRLSQIFARESIVWNRETEADLVDSLADAVAIRRLPKSGREADVYRLSAQLLKTKHRIAADFLDSAARQFHFQARTVPRPFPDVVKDGLVRDMPRLRSLLEKRMDGVRSW